MRVVRWWVQVFQTLAPVTALLAIAGCKGGAGPPAGCPTGTHLCDGACVDSAAVEHCGAACTACPGSPNGDAVCENGACGLTCAQDFAPCAGGCCPVDTGLVFSNNGAVSPSIVVDSKQNPHVSFLADHYTLTYAHRDTGAWQVSSIDPKDGNAHEAASIAVTGDALPIVAYTGGYAVGIARFTGSMWTYETAYRDSTGYGPAIAGRSLALDSGGRPHVVEAQVQCGVAGGCNSYIVHIFWDGTAWGAEHIQDADGNSYSSPSLAIDSHDGLHVAWVGYYDGALYYAKKAGSTWTSGVALQDGSCCDTAYIAVNPMGAPFITYQTKDGTYAVASSPMAMGPWSESTLHPDVSLVGNLAFAPTDPFHYLLLDKAGELLHGSPSGSGWKESVISTEAKQFMLAVDASERAHVIMATPQAIKYVRVNKL